MTTSTSLLDWILSLFRDPAAREAFQADPKGYAAEHGFGNLSAADVHDILCLHADDSGGGSDDDDDHGRVPPPRDYHHDEDGTRYLEHHVNNYTFVEKHDTNIDNSVHQDIDTHGGDFSQVIDNDPLVASGDGAVAAGGDITDSTLTTGDGNVVGDGNQAVTGDGNSTAFGTGDATSANFDHASFGDGAAVSLTGEAAGYATDNDTNTAVHASGSGSTSLNAAGTHGYADQMADQQDLDTSAHEHVQDASHTDSHNVTDSFNDTAATDSHDYEAHLA
ncbi:IniB N-terminal domain-containing protein [Pseudonocardia acaciae]|uniref:IniB N-terminal domain-containing protein n=1 Tax=Pseudonocardia acaciae TaxID=551276 RepID=UPI000B115686|nr:IniB N-terminal domain-containing protein [Pseudonocardia acaciae]